MIETLSIIAVVASFVIAAFVVLMYLDCWVYCRVVDRHGRQGKFWTGSGFYCWWINRKEKKRDCGQ